MWDLQVKGRASFVQFFYVCILISTKKNKHCSFTQKMFIYSKFHQECVIYQFKKPHKIEKLFDFIIIHNSVLQYIGSLSSLWIPPISVCSWDPVGHNQKWQEHAGFFLSDVGQSRKSDMKLTGQWMDMFIIMGVQWMWSGVYLHLLHSFVHQVQWIRYPGHACRYTNIKTTLRSRDE